jgi:crotonobetainyl-CoA:carnitine CoA-transferase CaiB-like acyl-CoA transferase
MPLSHLRVAEIGSLPAGAFCARLFADFGADVLKLEPPAGDPGRFAPPLVDVGAGARESGYFGFLNFNKRSAIVPAGADAPERLHRLLSGADVVVDSSDLNEGEMPRPDHAALRRDNPAIVILSMSWFGATGPYRDFKATDAVCRALAGTVELVGPAEGPPRPIPDYQATPVAGLNAFIAGMAALRQAAQSGGRRLEISVHEANLAIADYSVALAWGIGAKDRRWGVNKFAPNFPLGIYRCKTGWIGITVVTPAQWKTFCQLLGLDDLIGDARYLVNRDRLRGAVVLEQRFAERFLTRTAEEWFAIGLDQRMPFVVVPNMADLLASPEHRRRMVFAQLTHGSRRYEVPGSPLRLASTPPKAGGAVPAAGAHPLAWTAETPDRPPQPAAPVDRPLTGLRVIDLSMGWAGPHATRHLADLGCDIVKVEACQYPDWWRGVDTRPIVIEQMLYEKSSYFNVLNRNKRGITLDLTTPDGVRLVKELVKGADAVIENYSAGVLPKLGLDYDSLRQVKPDLIMLSMPAFAADGVWRECRAYGSTLEQASGLPSVTGAPDGPPAMNHIAYGDPIGGLHAAAALLVALHHRRRTGEGNRIDMSQVECMLTMVAPWIAEQSANGKVAARSGARHLGHVPHNCFACRETDTWLLVAAADDTQWQALAETIGRGDLAADATLSTLAGRKAREGEIEAAVAAWSRGRSADEAMQELQRRGVAAGAVRSPLDLLDDPHLTARGFWQWIDRAHVGRHPQPSPAYRENETPYAITHPAPTLGQHNVDVLCGILGLSDDEVARLTDAGVIGTRAVPPNLRKARAAAG